MKNGGFSIRCPHCFDWSDWGERDPSGIVVASGEEWDDILRGLEGDPDHFGSDKMLTCKHHPEHGCPVSFQAFICPDDATAHRRRLQTPIWMQAHAFHLRGFNRTDKLPYGVVLVSARPVQRQKHIVLDSLIQRDLLGRAVLGMSDEINAPFTIFVPHFVDRNGHVSELWVPIEAYDHETRPVPSHFNLFCEICREAFIAPIIDECENKNCSPGNCPLGCGMVRDGEGICEGKPAACSVHPPNWPQCPFFVQRRLSLCRCYMSDQTFMSHMKDQWTNGSLSRTRCTSFQCWAGLQERALPVIIHEHLAGIAMTGQFVLRDDVKAIELDALVDKNPILRPHRRRLRRVLSLLNGEAEPRNGLEHHTARFVVSKDEMLATEHRFEENVQRIAEAANARYRHDRARSESVFREEIVARIAISSATRTKRLDVFLKILDRMRDFWAFCGVYWFTWSDSNKRLVLVARASRDRMPQFLNTYLTDMNYSIDNINCHPWLHRRNYQGGERSDPEQPPHPNPWIHDFRNAYERIAHTAVPELAQTGESSHFFAFVRQDRAVHCLVFAERDLAQVSSLRPAYKGDVSPVCQHAIADTCDSIVRAYVARDNLDLLRWQQRELTVGAIGTTLVHDLRHSLVLARDTCRDSERQVAAGDIPAVQNDLKALRNAIKGNLAMLDHVSRFRRERAPVFVPVKVGALVDMCISDALLPNKGIAPSLTIATDAEVPLDPLLVKVAINNLLTNAKQQAPKLSKVWVTVNATDKTDTTITIEDDGPGFSDQVLSEFDALHNGGILTSPDEPLGLGMVITKAVMDLHKGQLRIGNRPKGGSWIELRFRWQGDSNVVDTKEEGDENSVC